MSTKMARLVSESNLSRAWGRAFLASLERAEITPLLISVDGFNESIPAEDMRIREALDNALEDQEKFKCDVTSMLIFPYRLWNLMRRPHIDVLTKLYLESYFPRLVARDKTHNGKGTYFERMVNFVGVKKKDGNREITSKNQLEHIIKVWRRGIRQSALQVACFDPAKDHTGSAQGARIVRHSSRTIRSFVDGRTRENPI